MNLICLVFNVNEHEAGVLARHKARLPRPPANTHNNTREAMACTISGHLFGTGKVYTSYHVYNIARWTDIDMDTSSFITYFLGRTNLTSAWPFHSPASLHSSSHSWNRRPVPGQVWSWEDSSFRPYNTATSRASCRRMLRPGYVPHS